MLTVSIFKLKLALFQTSFPVSFKSLFMLIVGLCLYSDPAIIFVVSYFNQGFFI